MKANNRVELLAPELAPDSQKQDGIDRYADLEHGRLSLGNNNKNW
jgi:hypothetical protein